MTDAEMWAAAYKLCGSHRQAGWIVATAKSAPAMMDAFLEAVKDHEEVMNGKGESEPRGILSK